MVPELAALHCHTKSGKSIPAVGRIPERMSTVGKTVPLKV